MIRAVICDLYGTVLEVGPPPPDAEARWSELWRAHVGTSRVPALDEFEDAVRQRIPPHHAAGRARGLVQPEIVWPDLAADAYPELHRLPPAIRPQFFHEHARLCRSTRLAPGAADCLRALHQSGRVLGIASNAQACTRLELARSLADHGLDSSLFTEAVSYFSYQHGVAKPDPRVFRSLHLRLRTLGIKPSETLMVGDRPDTDIAPARAAGWAAWHLHPVPGPAAGDWPTLLASLGLR